MGAENAPARRGLFERGVRGRRGCCPARAGKAVERKRRGDEGPGGGRRPRRESACGAGSTRIPKRGRSLQHREADPEREAERGPGVKRKLVHRRLLPRRSAGGS